MKPGSNDPCPCGSGRKYKRCCQGASARSAEPPPASGKDQYLFEAGSYRTPAGYAPSIACRKGCEDGSWAYHFVVVRYVAVDALSDAEQMSRADLEAAFGDGADSGLVAERLKSAGYVAVDNFQIARDE